MTTYHIEHRTTYTYDSEVTGSYGQVHLRPRDLAWQTCLAHEIPLIPSQLIFFGTSTSTATSRRTSTFFSPTRGWSLPPPAW